MSGKPNYLKAGKPTPVVPKNTPYKPILSSVVPGQTLKTGNVLELVPGPEDAYRAIYEKRDPSNPYRYILTKDPAKNGKFSEHGIMYRTTHPDAYSVFAREKELRSVFDWDSKITKWESYMPPGMAPARFYVRQ